MSDDKTLRLLPDTKAASRSKATADGQPQGAPRFSKPNRAQLELRSVDLESTIPADHPARTFWQFVERLDLSKFEAPVRAREGVPGRDATDPRILLTLWLYATSEGIGSARELARLCESHDAYRWICGGVSTNHHTLSDFRVGFAEGLDELMTQVLAVMLSQGLVTLSRVALDGTRVRAHAGAASFRRQRRLEHFLRAAKEQVETAKKLADDPTVTARQAAAQERAARERAARLERALAEMPKAIASKKKGQEENARVSTTDPDARVMKMADGGYRPAFNVQFAATTEEKVITGVDVSNVGTDAGQMAPMLEQIETRCGGRPLELLVDGGYVNKGAITDAARAGTQVYAPTMQEKHGNLILPGRKRGDSPAVEEWRRRMESDEAKLVYRQRAATAELVNAQVKHQHCMTFLVRGIEKVRCVALLHALTYNLRRWASLTS